MYLSYYDRIKKWIKLFMSYPSYSHIFSEIKKEDNHRAVLIGAPIHTNLGDHLIAEECLSYVKSLGYKSVIEIPEFVFELFPKRILLRPSDIIFILGGGWMGNLYEDELVVESVLTRWNNNIIVILPQTIHFSEKGVFSSVDQLRNLLLQTKKLLVCTRDRRSYDLCINKLGLTTENCFLLPDMALQRLKEVKEKKELLERKIIFSLRNDAEKAKGTEIINNIRPLLIERGYTVIESSTVLPKKTIKFKLREQIIDAKIQEYANADLVITDRLHSMVFALIAGTKCIAIDNTTHKVLGVKNEWLKDYPGVKVYETADQVTIDEIEELLYSSDYPVKKEYIDELFVLSSAIQSK